MPDASGKKAKAAIAAVTPTKFSAPKSSKAASPAAKSKSDSTPTALKKKTSSASITIDQDNSKSKKSSKSNKNASVVAPTPTISVTPSQPSTSKSTKSTIQWQSLADPTVSSTEPPLFTPDGGYYFIPTADKIRIISRSTGTTVSTLSVPNLPFGHDAASQSAPTPRITALALYPSNPLQLLCARTDGTISVWDYLDARLLRIIYLPYSASSSSSQEELETGLAITHLVASEQCPDWAFVSVRRAKSLQSKGGSSFSTLLLAVQLSTSVCADGTAVEPLAHVAHSTPAGTRSVPIHIPRAQSRLGKIKLVPAALRLCPRAEHLVVISGHKIHVASLRKRATEEGEDEEQDTISSVGGLAKFTTSDDLTALAIHPSEASIATGDVAGKIRIFHGLLEESFLARRRSEADDEDVEMDTQQSHDLSSKKGKSKGNSDLKSRSKKDSFFGAPSTVLHWHAHAVSTLAYVPLAASGARLLSGGEEATLVLWHMSAGGGAGGSSTRAQREFVPRLGAGIASVTVAGASDSASSSSSKGAGHEEEIVVALRDGSFVFLSPATLAVLRTFARLKIDAGRHLFPVLRQRSMPAPLAIQPVRPRVRGGEPAYNLVLTSGHPSTIQFHDPVADAMVSELEVVSSNRVSRPDEAPIEPARVEHVAFSPLSASSKVAEWMATLDARRPSAASQMARFASEVSLKFWGWDAEEERYVLCTSIERPHGDEGTLSDLSFGWLAGSASDGETSVSTTARRFERLVCVSTGSDGKIKTWRPVPLSRAESLSAATSGAKQGKKKHKKDENAESDQTSAPALASQFHWVARSIFSFRSTLPRALAWAPTLSSSSSRSVGADASAGLIAVAQGAFVTVWELGVSSNSLCVALCAPQLVSVSDAQQLVSKTGASADLIHGARTCAFVGRAGRFVVGASRTVAVCWDLLTGSIVWTKTYGSGKSASVHQGKDDPAVGQRIVQILPVPSGSPSNAEEVFGVLLTDSVTRTSKVELFDIASLLRQPERNKPDAALEIPFVARSLVQVPAAAQTPGSGKIKSAANAIAGYAITSSFEPIQIGRPAALTIGWSSDADNEQQEAYAVIPRDSTEDAVRSRRVRTILDDLLGGGQAFLPDDFADSTAMAKRKNVTTSSLMGSAGTQGRKKTAGEEVFAMFDEPAHLLPPMTSLFDAFSAAILPRRAGAGKGDGLEITGAGSELEEDDGDEE